MTQPAILFNCHVPSAFLVGFTFNRILQGRLLSIDSLSIHINTSRDQTTRKYLFHTIPSTGTIIILIPFLQFLSLPVAETLLAYRWHQWRWKEQIALVEHCAIILSRARKHFVFRVLHYYALRHKYKSPGGEREQESSPINPNDNDANGT